MVQFFKRLLRLALFQGSRCAVGSKFGD